MPPERPSKILVVVLDNLGDAIMTTAVFRPIQKIFPGASIGIWIKEYAAGVFEDQSMVDRIHPSDPPWDSAPGRAKGDWKTFYETLKDIRAENYDLAFIMNTEWRRSLACRWAGIPVRVGFDQRKSRFFLTHPIERPADNRSRVETHRALLEGYLRKPLSADWFSPRVEVTQKEKEWADRWAKKQEWNGNPIVVLHPFSGDPGKNWPLKNWFDLIRELSRQNNSLRFSFSCSPPERLLLHDELSMIDRKHCYVESTSLREMKGIFNRAALFIGGDSGPGHLAAAMGKPVLSLFGPSDPAVYAARGRGRIDVMQRDPLSSLPVEEVAKRALEML